MIVRHRMAVRSLVASILRQDECISWGWRFAVLVFAVAMLDSPSATRTCSGASTHRPSGLRRAVSWTGCGHDAGASQKVGGWIVAPGPLEPDDRSSRPRRQLPGDFPPSEATVGRAHCDTPWPPLFGLGTRGAQTEGGGRIAQHKHRPELQPCRRLLMQLRGGSIEGDLLMDGAAGAMEMTETLEPSAEREKGVVGPAASAGDEGGASVEEINVGSSGMSAPLSPTAAGTAGGNGLKGSSYMGSSVGTGSGDAGDGGSGGSGGSGTGGMGSSSTVKTYRHPTSSKKRNMIREKFVTALTPFYREQEDKYTPLTAAVAIEHSMYRYFGKV